MRFVGHCSLVFSCLLLAISTGVSAKPLTEQECFVLAQAPGATPYGQGGSAGKTGDSGRSGSASENVTIFADGAPLTLNLTGRDGENGQNGGEAKAPDCGKQPENVTQNLVSADGGNGGNGGNGGDGGNAGSISIYTTNFDNLRQILVTAAGGKGGQPGEGGEASAGCQCTRPYWTVERCFGKPGDADYRCNTQEFRCQNGRNGLNGTRGLPGRDGLPGKLTLLNLNKPLEADRPTATVTLATVKDQGFTLSKNKWETRQGAQALLATGSVIDDQYLLLTERLERSFLLLWNAPQPFNNVANLPLTLSLDANQEIQTSFPGELWLEGAAQKRGNVTEFVVYNALRSSEATRLDELVLAGNGTGLKLFLVDKADRSNLVATKFRVEYNVTDEDPRFRPASTYSTKFAGEIPDRLVTVNGDRLVINLGQLPIPEQYAKPGVGVEVVLTATRSFAGYSAEQTLVVQEVLRHGTYKTTR